MKEPESDPGRECVPLCEWLCIHTALVWASEREIEEPFLDAPYAGGSRVLAWLVRRGRVMVKAGGSTAVAGEGEWLFPGTAEGWQKIERGSVLLSLNFLAQWPTGALLFPHQETLVFSAESERKLSRAAAALASRVGRISGEGGGLFMLHQGQADVRSYFGIRRAFEGWLEAYVDTMLRLGQRPSRNAPMDDRVARAARLLDHQPWRLPVREQELACMVGVSVSQLNRLFARDLGVSPKGYLERRRLQAATLLLDERRRSVKEVAYELGFHSLPHFSAWFRQHRGTSPRAFQRRGSVNNS